MKFGVNTFIWTADFGESNLPLLPLVKEHGFDGVEVPIFRPSEFAAATIRRGLEANSLECTVCTVLVGGMNLVSEDAGVRRKTRAHLKASVEAVAEAGSKILAGPLYSPVSYLPGRRRTQDEWKWAVEGFQSLGPILETTGVNLAIEPLNRFETYFLNTAADAVKLCDEVAHPSVGILFDTFHANIEEKDIAAGYRTVARHLKHVHTCENDRGTPGSGHVDWNGFFTVMRELKYDGWFTIESFGFAMPALSAAACIWRDIERTPEAIAFDGIEFLRKGLGAGSESAVTG